MKRFAIAVALALAAATLVATPAHAAGTTFTGTYTNAAGIRGYRGYVPSSYQPGTPMPLLVALHGCNMSAKDMEDLTRYNELAEARGFIVVYPEQSILANLLRCWNFAPAGNHIRDKGEPSIIAGITAKVRSQYTVDTRRTYVIGASSGAAMSVIMGATYPDVYAAIGSVAGGPFPGDQNATPEQNGLYAYQAMGAYARKVPAFVLHGLADTTVDAQLGRDTVTQWAQTDDLALDGGVDDDDVDAVADTTRQATENGRAFTHYTYNQADTGESVIEAYFVEGMGHRWPSGCTCSRYGDPLGPDASRISWDFFMAHPKP
ncbi:extracellular catalytic domain type 1 short-chain-length polyhydroxyalkanoate depolymerase [Nonomuraea sp. NPDC004354]|uniref:extracellular catalytic domain type 1 short-chain-length polyhydroxyalkanoate depolymerase n=1 Tax=Nonomuraea sp. NPDC003804 TaxID=3154547 RepID=UPI0033B8CE95